ncbi:hypothetical protein O4G76_07610 [Limimaricola sp. G21655-S1]|uniref:hypothetical protein n=1 Tax=Limimaricola sp. G21655-S1 TaxID=3014768 RepID=UPI0022AF5A54|nr:hypothetical protein [Limimaricola sp. G21655-S1]MCZ4260705.1 hypothetical protein [Limimaricola sp. G21655-S1]
MTDIFNFKLAGSFISISGASTGGSTARAGDLQALSDGRDRDFDMSKPRNACGDVNFEHAFSYGS